MTAAAPPAARAGRPDLTTKALAGPRRFTNHLATAAIWFVIYIAPILCMLIVAIVVLLKLARRWRTREA